MTATTRTCPACHHKATHAERHCGSRPCTWWWCPECRSLTDPAGRYIATRKGRAWGDGKELKQ